MNPLSPRLEKIVNLLDPVEVLGDIGCDHGYIIFEALKNGTIEKGIATDISPPSLKKSELLLKSEYGRQSYDCRLGDGLEVIGKNEAKACVIAGMGGILISNILTSSMEKVKEMEYIILQPMQAEEELFHFLSQASFELISASMVSEKDRFYPILKIKYSENGHIFSWKDFLQEKEFENFVKKNIERFENIQQDILKKSKDVSKADHIERKKKEWEAYLGECI